jgi:AcrR family transcriptional regulator
VRDARQRLLDAGEVLIAEQGVAMVSLRQIAEAAGHRNTSAVAYHFGSKRALVQAIYADRMRAPDLRRQQLLAELDAAGRGDDLAALVGVFLRPLTETLESRGPSSWLRFLVNTIYGAQLAPELGADDSTAGIHELSERIGRHLEALPPSVRALRWDAFVRLVLHTLAAYEAAMAVDRVTAPLDVVVADLAEVLVALLRAPAASYAATASAVMAR